MKKTTLALSLTLVLTACGGGGGEALQNSLTTRTKDLTWQQVDLADAIAKSTVASSPSEWMGNFPPLVVDLNQDGYDDLILPVFVVRPGQGSQQPVRPIVLVFDPVQARYQRRTDIEQEIGVIQNIAEALVTDLNRDQKPDLFIADAGYDEASYGAANRIYLNQGQLAYKDLMTQTLDLSFRDYSHHSVLADFDGDGAKDIFVLNNRLDPSRVSRCQDANLAQEYCPYQHLGLEQRSYFILADSPRPRIEYIQSPWEVKHILEGSSMEHADRLNMGAAADLDKDGRQDLVVNTSNEIIILLNQGNMNWRVAARIPATACPGQSVYESIQIRDLNKDGEPEIITNYRCLRDKKYRFQVLGRMSTTWQDQTSQYFDQTNIDDTWDYRFGFVDIDQDGDLDIVQAMSNRIYTWTGTKFTAGVVPYHRLGQTLIRLGTRQCSVALGSLLNEYQLYTYCLQ